MELMDSKAYASLVKGIKECEKNGNLPQMIPMEDLSNVNMDDLWFMFRCFKADTGLSMQFSAFLCQDCGRLHGSLFIDYPDEDDAPASVLQ